jgi:Icc-related predicted phosphoesterase
VAHYAGGAVTSHLEPIVFMRIVALSDLHGHLPEIPACDLLIVAGDVCPDRIGPARARDHPAEQKAWFDRNVRAWLAGAAATHKVLTWGNHDWCGEACSFAADSPVHASSRVLQILVDDGTSVPLDGAAGRSLSIWATPWSNQFMQWAFMKPREALAAVYAAIPQGIDILVSHQPPFGHGDRYEHAGTRQVEHLGSRELLSAIDRVRPRLVICGHMHEGQGCFDYDGVAIYNVSVVNDQYRLVRSPTVIDIADW